MHKVRTESRLRGSFSAVILIAAISAMAGCSEQEPEAPPRNIVIFVADGLRPSSVTPTETPTFAAIRRDGTFFSNSYSLFPTYTMANASAIATGYGLGSTGFYANAIYVGFPVHSAADNPTPFMEQNPLLGEVSEHFGGTCLGVHSVIELAREAGLSTATIGKLGPTLLQDVTARSGKDTIVVDDSTGSMAGIPLPAELQGLLQGVGLPLTTPGRGDNGKRGDFMTPGTKVANILQQQYFADVTTNVVLPLFKKRGTPFLLVYWSRDPDGSQHNQGDSLNQLTPGINGPTAQAGIRNADANLAAIQKALRDLNLESTTDLLVTSDHGFFTISKESTGSFAAQQTYSDVPKGLLPPGFLAIDLSKSLGLPLFDPEQLQPVPTQVDPMIGKHPKSGSGILGLSATQPQVVVAANGGADLIYLPSEDASTVLPKIVSFLLEQDYVSGLFVDDRFGQVAGTLPLSSINLRGIGKTPVPAIVVNFRSGDTGCGDPAACGFAVTDWYLQQGQGMHGSFARSDTLNNMAAIGPDFQRGFVDTAPVSNADLGATVATLLRLPTGPADLRGRILGEALVGPLAAPAPSVMSGLLESAPGGSALLKTTVRYQEIAGQRYFAAGGFPGRTGGL